MCLDSYKNSSEATGSIIIGFIPFGEAVQEGEDVFRGDLIDGTITEFFNEPLNNGLIGSDRIFFEWDLR